MKQILHDLSEVPLYLLTVVLGLILALREDRAAACFFIGGVILTIAYGWPIVGALIILYGVLLGVATVVRTPH